jgi:hypothetical protein
LYATASAAGSLYCYEQWLREDVHMAAPVPGLHLYWAMDLEANKEAIGPSSSG